jgi:hypothetical protein
MSDSPAFEHLCGELEASSNLDRLEARGTVRIALKAAGLEPRAVTPEQLDVVLEKLLAEELASRGVPDPVSLCDRLRAGLKGVRFAGARTDSPEAVFARLGGGA